MDIALILRKRYSKCVLALAVLLCMISSLPGCNSRTGRHPYDLAGEWSCTELPFTLSYSKDADGILIQSELMEWNGESIAVDLAFSINTYCVYPENSSHYDDRLFSGTWKYRDGSLVLLITEDFTFDYQYVELSFVPTT